MTKYRSNSLSLSQQEQLFNKLNSYEDEALFRLALTTGIRRLDIVNIMISNVNLDKRELSFWQHKKRKIHTVPLTHDVARILGMYINSLPKQQKRLFAFSDKTAYNKLQRALKRAQITKQISFHDLRRSFTKTAKKRGLSLKAVAQILDDKPATVQMYYENLDMDELRDEVDKL